VMQEHLSLGARCGGSIYRAVDETLVIAVSDVRDAAVEEHGDPGDCEVAGADRPVTDPWTGKRTEDVAETKLVDGEVRSRDAGDGIQIICRYDDSKPRVKPVRPAQPPPPPPAGKVRGSPSASTTSTSMSADVGECSSIVVIDGDSFVIHSRLTGREEGEDVGDDVMDLEDDDDVSDDAGSDVTDDEGNEDVESIAERCRRFFEARLQAHCWLDLEPPEPPDDVEPPSSSEPSERPTSSSERDECSPGSSECSPAVSEPDECSRSSSESDEREDELDERPVSVDSGRESGTDSQGAGDEPPLKDLVKLEGEVKLEVEVKLEGVLELEAVEEMEGEVKGLPDRPPPSQLELKMALLRREMRELMQQDDQLFRQLLALHDSIQTLRVGGDGSTLSPSSSLCSIPESAEDAISCSAQSHLSAETQSHLSAETQSHLSTEAKSRSSFFDLPAETASCTLAKEEVKPERSFFAELLHVTGLASWTRKRASRLLATSTPEQVAPLARRQVSLPSLTVTASQTSTSSSSQMAAPSYRLAASPSLTQVAALLTRQVTGSSPVRPGQGKISREKTPHRRQGSCDSGIVEEIRAQS